VLAVVVAAAWLAAQTGEGEGEGEGAPDPCAPACIDAATLSFCDTGTPVTLACATVADGARCGPLSNDWGDDCLLPDGATCDPGYGFGDSRCDDGLACRDGACAPGAPEPEPPLSPTAGTVAADTTTPPSPTSCAGAGVGLLPLALALARRRRRPA